MPQAQAQAPRRGEQIQNTVTYVCHATVPDDQNGEHYLTGEEVCKRLCISKRTLQDYRDTGLLGYVQLPGKIIYRESDIMDLLERFYQK